MKVKSPFCLSISGPTFEQCNNQIQLSNFVEFRLDLYHLTEAELFELLQTSKSYIATCRREDEKKSLFLLKKAIDLGADFIDIDIHRKESFIKSLKDYSAQHNCKLIISYHNYEITPSQEELSNIYKQGIELGADLFKIATFVNTESDNSVLLGLYSNHNNLVAFGMGEVGKISRLSSLYCGAPYTYVSASLDSSTASGQFTYKQLINIVNTINQQEKKPICLIGFMGVGKTTIGRALANQNKVKFIDLDQEIEKEAKQNISTIFETKGEDYFRAIESKLFKKISLKRNVVIACGGGIIQQDINRIILQDKTNCIWLKADVAYCLNQIKENDRPLLEVNNRLKFALDLYKKREPLYKSSSHTFIEVKEKSILQICNQINEKINFTL